MDVPFGKKINTQVIITIGMERMRRKTASIFIEKTNLKFKDNESSHRKAFMSRRPV